MVRQARSEATRRKIITSAVQLFNENGYPVTGLGDIIERAEMTKGALYYHFDSKKSLATAIIEESGARLAEAFRTIAASPAPALESIIHGVFLVADLLTPTRSPAAECNCCAHSANSTKRPHKPTMPGLRR